MKIIEKKRKTDISERQQIILRCIASGYNTVDIALDLKVSPATIHAEINSMFAKTETLNRAHLISWAYQNGIL